jgi:hypothetical protein
LSTVNTDVTTLKNLLGVIRESRFISDLITINKKSIEDLKKYVDEKKTITDAVKHYFPKMVERLDKVKIPHRQFSNIVYTLESGSFVWAVTSNILPYTATVKGIYRLTLISPIQFNISTPSSSGVNNVISTIIDKDATERFTITSTDANLARASVTWYIEFIAELSK